MSYRDSENGNSTTKNLETAAEDVLGGKDAPGDEEHIMIDTIPRMVADESAHGIGLEMYVFDEPASVAAAADEPIEQSVNTMEDVENHLDEAYMGSVEISSVEETDGCVYVSLSANADDYDFPLPGTISIEPSDYQHRGE
jgi:hypothetical protein